MFEDIDLKILMMAFKLLMLTGITPIDAMLYALVILMIFLVAKK